MSSSWCFSSFSKSVLAFKANQEHQKLKNAIIRYWPQAITIIAKRLNCADTNIMVHMYMKAMNRLYVCILGSKSSSMDDSTAHVTSISYPMHSSYPPLQPQVRCITFAMPHLFNKIFISMGAVLCEEF